jgi:hypothetical protein
MSYFPTSPRLYQGVMVSSTFTDMVTHRAELIGILKAHGFFDVAMENSSAKPTDVINSSVDMVRDASAYIGVISHKYGQTPACSRRNPAGLSLTELEFDEAIRLGRPVLLFVMGDGHAVVKADVEIDSDKLAKLSAFRERAKQMGQGEAIERVYATFNSLEECVKQVAKAVGGLRQHLDPVQVVPDRVNAEQRSNVPTIDPIPAPPALYAAPSYIGSHAFVGRHAQLETLSDWASPADNHPVLLFEAIGGTGKSMLTWEWINKHSPKVRADWAGRFWYSFYERGATMVDFCRRALAYMTSQPLTSFKDKNTVELSELLLRQLQAQPWLLVLDGLERVLVSYHRFDAAQQLDEHAGKSDSIASRDPCAAINSEDDDLLRFLAGASPSKLLLTSRLIPRALLNKSHQPIPGVLRELLPGLRPADAEALIRSCGVTGESQDIQTYLKKNCDCHPLVVGVLAGLINDYMPNRGNFDSWATDPIGGGRLNFSKLDLVQKRNHILNTALAALPESSRQLLSTVALLTDAVDYPTLCEINPSLSPIPELVPIPKPPQDSSKWQRLPPEDRVKMEQEYQRALWLRATFEIAIVARREEMRGAAIALASTVKDLELRGLLQYDNVARRYDLHPVVRGIATAGLPHDEKSRYGQRLVDHFSARAQDPFEEAESLAEFDNARRIINAFFQMGKVVEARDFVLKSTLLESLNRRFEAHNEILTIVRPFFTAGWGEMPPYLAKRGGVPLTKRASTALRRTGSLSDAFIVAETGLELILKTNMAAPLCSQLLNLASTLGSQNRLAQEDRLMVLAGNAAKNLADKTSFFLARYRQMSKLGRWEEADQIWLEYIETASQFEPMFIPLHHRAVHLYLRGALTEADLSAAEKANRLEKSALGIRNLSALRGYWQLENSDFAGAKASLAISSMLARQAGKVDRRVEIELALAKFRLAELAHPVEVAEQFTSGIEDSCALSLAQLWHDIGDNAQSLKHALDGYAWAFADGPPFSRCFEAKKAIDFLAKLGAEPPRIAGRPNSKFSWEARVTTAIERIR